MNNKTKIIIAVVLFALAAVVVAYQFGLFGENAPKQPAEVKQTMEQDHPAAISGSGSKPGG